MAKQLTIGNTTRFHEPPQIGRIHASVRWVRNVFWHFRVIFKGMFYFARTGKNLPEVRQHLISLFCKTRGVGLDALHLGIQMVHPPYAMKKAAGVLGDFSSKDLDRIAKGIRQDGYYVFPQRMPTDILESLMEITRTVPALPDGRTDCPPTLYDAAQPQVIRYFYSEECLFEQPVAQTILMDRSILSVAQRYLNCAPILDIISLGWSTAFTQEPKPEAAQMYHFDLDRIKWLKFFLYVTDVSPNNGPHCYIKGTHRPFRIPGPIISKHYARLADEELFPYYPQQQFVELTAPRGTWMAVDTRGLHKGKPLTVGHRLLWGMEFCDHLVGATFDRPAIRPAVAKKLESYQREFPRVLTKYLP